jgi:hypothetical protein
MSMQAKVDNDVTPSRDYGVVTAPDTVHLERLLPGPIERVWSYLTDSEKRGHAWSHHCLRPAEAARLYLEREFG